MTNVQCSMTNVRCSMFKYNNGKMKTYRLKITLKHVKPPIWRRIETLSDTRLDHLAQTILHAMGWYGGHLMSFEIDGMEYHLDHESVYDLGGKLMRKTRLDKCLTAEKQKALFTYDFGDDWQHEILLEKILEPEPGATYPRCTAGAHHCPPEDCGGPWGYADILNALKDPDNPEHAELLEWVGEDFDPEAFSVEAVNERMRG